MLHATAEEERSLLPLSTAHTVERIQSISIYPSYISTSHTHLPTNRQRITKSSYFELSTSHHITPHTRTHSPIDKSSPAICETAARITESSYFELSPSHHITSHEHILPVDESASSVSLAGVHKQSYQPSARLHVVQRIKGQAPEMFESTTNTRIVLNVSGRGGH